MTRINYNLNVRRKNMRCTKFECDMAKAIVGSFKETVEDNKRMKDALLLFTQYLRGILVKLCCSIAMTMRLMS